MSEGKLLIEAKVAYAEARELEVRLAALGRPTERSERTATREVGLVQASAMLAVAEEIAKLREILLEHLPGRIA